MWKRGDRVQVYVLDMAYTHKVVKRGTVLRLTTGVRGNPLVEVLFDCPPRSTPTEIIAFRPEELIAVKQERKGRVRAEVSPSLLPPEVQDGV